MRDRLSLEPLLTDEDIWLGYLRELDEELMEALRASIADASPPLPHSPTTWVGRVLSAPRFGKRGGKEILKAYPPFSLSTEKQEE